MAWEIVGDITDIQLVAAGNSIREIGRLRKLYGRGRWRKLKGVAKVPLPDQTVSKAELHGYEAHGIGQRALCRVHHERRLRGIA